MYDALHISNKRIDDRERQTIQLGHRLAMDTVSSTKLVGGLREIALHDHVANRDLRGIGDLGDRHRRAFAQVFLHQRANIDD